MDFGLRVTWHGQALPAEARERFFEQYLEASGVDPFHTAPTLRAIPVLLLHAAFDRVVPAATGDLLRDASAGPSVGPFYWGMGVCSGGSRAWQTTSPIGLIMPEDEMLAGLPFGRHTHASRLREEGVDIGIISKQLGHASISTTAHYLDHIAPWAVVEAVAQRDWRV